MAYCPADTPIRGQSCTCPPGTHWQSYGPVLDVIGGLFGNPSGICQSSGSQPKTVPQVPVYCPNDTTVIQGNCQCQPGTIWVTFNQSAGQNIGQCRSQGQIQRNIDQAGPIGCAIFATLANIIKNNLIPTPDLLQGVFNCFAGQPFQVGQTTQTGSLIANLIQQGKIKFSQGTCDPGFLAVTVSLTYGSQTLPVPLCVDPSVASQLGLSGGSAPGPGGFDIGSWISANPWILPVAVIGVFLIVFLIGSRR